MGVKYCIFRSILIFAAFVTFIVLIPNLPPYTTFTSIELEPLLPRVGALAPNTALNNAQKLYHEKLLGPEAFQLYNGEVYTSLATGEIVKLSPGGHVTFVTKIGQPCAGLHEEEKCGRPLDFKIDEKENKLIVADAYYGIWKVDLKTGRKQLLVSPRVQIDGSQPSLFNSIALDRSGDFYWTSSCTDFALKDGVYCITADPSGRLFHYNAARNQSRVLADNLWFANGVALSPDRQFVVVAETARYRLMKHYVDGPHKGKTEVFVAGLPGSPDNVRALPDESGVLVGLYTVFDAQHPLLSRTLTAAPQARKLLARLMRLIEIPFEFLHAQYPHVIFQTVTDHIGSFKSMASFLPPMSGLVQIDWSGKIVASYYNTDRSVGAISDAIVVKDKLYTGSPHIQNFVGVVQAPEGLKKAFAQKAAPKETPRVEPAKEAPKVQAKPVESKPKVEAPKPTQPPPKQAEKPTTTTPKPTTTTPKPTTTTPKPTTTTPKPTTTAPKPTTTAPKPTTTARKPTAAPPKPTMAPTKPAETKPKPAEPKEDKASAPKKVEAKPEKKPPQPKPEEKKVPETIPIEEEIPSDTAKPRRETLKVIKKEGPAEIPVRP